MSILANEALHGAAGYWDEILAGLIGLAFLAVLLFALFRSRNFEPDFEETDEQARIGAAPVDQNQDEGKPIV
jgi:hypothetical protein